jgi:hypothetical protein
MAEWVFDPRRRHITPDDEQAARLCLFAEDLPPMSFTAPGPATATVTPIASRLGSQAAHHPEPRGSGVPPLPAGGGGGGGGGARGAARAGAPPAPRRPHPPPPRGSGVPPLPAGARGAALPGPPGAAGPAPREPDGERRPAEIDAPADGPADPPRERPVRKAAGGRSRRASVPSWDEIMLGNSRQPD